MDRLLAALAAVGLAVVPGAEPGQLVLRGPKESRTPELMAGLKLFKPDLLARFHPPAEAAGNDAPEPEGDPYGGQ